MVVPYKAEDQIYRGTWVNDGQKQWLFLSGKKERPSKAKGEPCRYSPCHERNKNLLQSVGKALKLGKAFCQEACTARVVGLFQASELQLRDRYIAEKELIMADSVGSPS